MSNSLVKLYSAHSGSEAVIIMSLLDSAGFRYVIDTKTLKDIRMFITSLDTTMGPIDFYIREEDFEEARKLIETMRNEQQGV